MFPWGQYHYFWSIPALHISSKQLFPWLSLRLDLHSHFPICNNHFKFTSTFQEIPTLLFATANDWSLQHYAWLQPSLCLCLFLWGQYVVKFSCLFLSLSSSSNDSTELSLRMLQHITIVCPDYCHNDPTKCSTFCGLGFIAMEIIDSDGNTVPVLSVCVVCKCLTLPCLISKMYQWGYSFFGEYDFSQRPQCHVNSLSFITMVSALNS